MPMFSFAFSVVSTISTVLTTLFVHACQKVLYCMLFVSIAYYLGWFHRLLWFLFEVECRKALNGTPVSAGNLQFDLIRGRCWASNVIIHSPTNPSYQQRQAELKQKEIDENENDTLSNRKKRKRKAYEWKWESPLLARIGKLYLETNLVRCVLSMWFLGEEPPLELYTVHMSDIQVFVERRHNIYNFYLCDPHVILPDMSEVENEEEAEMENDDMNHQHDELNNDLGNENSKLKTTIDQTTKLISISSSSSSDNNENSAPKSTTKSYTAPLSPVRWVTKSRSEGSESSPQREQAQMVVEELVHAVREAATNGDWQGAWSTHKNILTTQLRAATRNKKHNEVLQESVRMIQQVSKSVVEKTQNAQQVVLPARQEVPGEKIVYGRVGRVLIQDMRVFLHKQKSFKDDENDPTTSTKLKSSHWKKPIYIQRVSIRPSELCPPLSALDNTYTEGFNSSSKLHMPALYQSVDKCLEVVWKRVMAEMAKTNTDRFFKTAVDEMVDVFVANKSSSASIASTSTSVL